MKKTVPLLICFLMIFCSFSCLTSTVYASTDLDDSYKIYDYVSKTEFSKQDFIDNDGFDNCIIRFKENAKLKFDNNLTSFDLMFDGETYSLPIQETPGEKNLPSNKAYLLLYDMNQGEGQSATYDYRYIGVNLINDIALDATYDYLDVFVPSEEFSVCFENQILDYHVEINNIGTDKCLYFYDKCKCTNVDAQNKKYTFEIEATPDLVINSSENNSLQYYKGTLIRGNEIPGLEITYVGEGYHPHTVGYGYSIKVNGNVTLNPVNASGIYCDNGIEIYGDGLLKIHEILKPVEANFEEEEIYAIDFALGVDQYLGVYDSKLNLDIDYEFIEEGNDGKYYPRFSGISGSSTSDLVNVKSNIKVFGSAIDSFYAICRNSDINIEFFDVPSGCNILNSDPSNDGVCDCYGFNTAWELRIFDSKIKVDSSNVTNPAIITHGIYLPAIYHFAVENSELDFNILSHNRNDYYSSGIYIDIPLESSMSYATNHIFKSDVKIYGGAYGLYSMEDINIKSCNLDINTAKACFKSVGKTTIDEKQLLPSVLLDGTIDTDYDKYSGTIISSEKVIDAGSLELIKFNDISPINVSTNMAGSGTSIYDASTTNMNGIKYVEFTADDNEQSFTTGVQSINYGSNNPVEFVTDASYTNESDVVVTMDNEVVDPSNYTLAHGSTHVTLKGDYLSSLVPGSHNITISIYNYSPISQDFTVNAPSSPNKKKYSAPKTGVN